MKLVNPAFPQPERRGGQSQQAKPRIALAQMAQNLLILTVVVIADAVAFVDDKQRKFTLKIVRIAGHRLYAAEYHFGLTLLALKPGGIDICFQAQRTVFSVVLLHQFFNVREHQHAAARHPRQFGDDNAFTRARRQDDHGRVGRLTKVGEGGVHRFALIGS